MFIDDGQRASIGLMPKRRYPATSTCLWPWMLQSCLEYANRMHKAFLAARLGKALDLRAVEPVASDILGSVRRNSQAFAGLMRCKLQNELVYRHALAVSALMVSLARQMKLVEKEAYEAGLAGLLLDIGVNYLPKDLNPHRGYYRNVDLKILAAICKPWPQGIAKSR